MLGYLNDFFKTFEYDSNDAAQLLNAYEVVLADRHSEQIFNEIMYTYDNNINIDYQQEVLDKINKISHITCIHEYTIGLMVFICMSKHLREVYIQKGIDMQIFKDSMLDLKWKLDECKVVKGICGSFVCSWFCGFYNMTRFALGRLQFELITIWLDYEKDGVKLVKDKSKVINVHIPRTGTPIDKLSCDASYALAREFFKDEVGENCAFVCYSWLLYPENKNILHPESNTYRFMSEYDIVQWKEDSGENLWRLFDTDEKDPHKLPADGSMRRAYVDHLLNGGKVGSGFGIKI